MSLDWSPCQCRFTVYVSHDMPNLKQWIYEVLEPAMQQVDDSKCPKDHAGRAKAQRILEEYDARGSHETPKEITRYGRFLALGLVTKFGKKPYMKGTISKLHLGAAREWTARMKQQR